MIERNFQRAVLEVLAISPRFDSHPVFNAVAVHVLGFFCERTPNGE